MLNDPATAVLPNIKKINKKNKKKYLGVFQPCHIGVRKIDVGRFCPIQSVH